MGLVLTGTIVPAQINNKQKTIDSLKTRLGSPIADSDKVAILLKLIENTPCADSLQKISFARQAIAICERNRLERKLYKVYQSLGDVYQYCINENEEARIYYEAAYNVAVQIKDPHLEVNASFSLAEFHKSLGHYSTALDYFNKVILLSPNSDTTVGVWGNIGEVYRAMGDNTKALQCYERALQIINHIITIDTTKTSTYTLDRSGLLITTAGVYEAMGDYDKALKSYTAALSDAMLVKDKNMKDYLSLLSYIGMGHCHHAKQQNDIAIQYYEKALTYARSFMTTTAERADILDELANIYLGKKNVKEAESLTEEALQISKKTGDKSQLSKSYTTLGKIYVAGKDYKKAVQYLQQSISMAKETGSKINEKDAWLVLSNAYMDMNQPAGAFDAYKKYVALNDSVYNADKAKTLTQMLDKGENDRKQFADSVEHANERKLSELRIQRQRIFIYSGFGGVALMILLAFFVYRNYSNERKANIIIGKANETIKAEKQISETLLLNILPEHVANELKAKGDVEAKQFDNVTVFFSDFVNFTSAGEKFTASELVAELHACFKAFDEIISKYNIEKIKTVGDAYVAVSGLPKENTNHAADMLSAALEIRDFMLSRKQMLGDKTFGVRIGLNSGSVVAGVVGVRKFAYDIWGDTVNTAARMEQHSENGKVNITEATYQIVKDKFVCTYRGEIEAKNKGMMNMYFVEKHIHT